MRLIALSIVISAGAFMAAVATAAKAFTDKTYFYHNEEWGFGVVVVGLIGLFFELYLWPLFARRLSTRTEPLGPSK